MGTELRMLLLSAIPFTEMKFTIPVAIANGMDPLKALCLGSLGNALPILPLIVLTNMMTRWARKFKRGGLGYHQRMSMRVNRKGESVKKYGALGVMLFVAVPLPGTGVYAGVMLAQLMQLSRIKSAIALGLGVFMAAIQVTIASVGIKELYSFTENLYMVIGVLLLIGGGYCLGKKKLQNRRIVICSLRRR